MKDITESGKARATKRRFLAWGITGILYLLFFYWYTSFGGPLTDEEIAHYLSIMQTQGADAEGIERMRGFLESDTGDDFVMMNIIEMHDTPLTLPGVQPGETSSEVLDKYMAYMWPALLSRASHPVIFATVASDSVEVWGIENARSWTQGAYMRYRSRRDLMEIAANPDFQGPHEFKIAAMAKTIAIPGDPWMHTGDPRLLLALVLLVVVVLLDRLISRQ